MAEAGGLVPAGGGYRCRCRCRGGGAHFIFYHPGRNNAMHRADGAERQLYDYLLLVWQQRYAERKHQGRANTNCPCKGRPWSMAAPAATVDGRTLLTAIKFCTLFVDARHWNLQTACNRQHDAGCAARPSDLQSRHEPHELACKRSIPRSPRS